jgi:hypothetical protein
MSRKSPHENDHIDHNAPAGGGGLGFFRIPRSPQPLGAHRPHSSRHRLTLTVYPGERSVPHRSEHGVPDHYVVLGHIYVGHDAYEIAAGPPPGHESKGEGGHSAGPTPAGNYWLGPRRHHTTMNWPASVVPWGAQLRFDSKGDIEFQERGAWRHATGRRGAATEAMRRYFIRTFKEAPASMEPIDKKARALFLDATGALLATYNRNDFGIWAWNLEYKHGRKSPYYIHTTAENEAETASIDSAAAAGREAGLAVLLEMSHGCIHLIPKDRDDMMRKGYLHTGARVVVKHYREKGPPR